MAATKTKNGALQPVPDTVPDAVPMGPAQDFGAALDRILESDVPVEKWKLAMDMRRELLAEQKNEEREQQRRAYFRARAALVEELPQVVKTRPVQFEKGGRGYKYAAWEDFDDASREILIKHGFFWTFRIEESVLYVSLNHRDGYAETAHRTIIPDPTMRNPYHAIKSAISYLKRTLAENLLNIVSRGDDDDATAAGDALLSVKVNEDQIKTIERVIAPIPKLSKKKFLSTMLTDIERVEDIPARDFPRVINALNARAARSKENADI